MRLVDGADLRRCPIEERKQRLAAVLRQPHHGIALNQTYEGDGAVIYQFACALGCEGIVSKRLGSTYRMGRTDQWLKIKNLVAPAVPREREIDCGQAVTAALPRGGGSRISLLLLVHC